MNDRNRSSLECALEDTKVFLENQQREMDLMKKESEMENLTQKRHTKVMQRNFLYLFGVLVLVVVLMIVVCHMCGRGKKKRRHASGNRETPVEISDLESVNEHNVRTLNRNLPTHQIRLIITTPTERQQPITERQQPITERQQPTAPNLYDIQDNRFISTRNNEPMLVDPPPPSYDDCMKKVPPAPVC